MGCGGWKEGRKDCRQIVLLAHEDFWNGLQVRLFYGYPLKTRTIYLMITVG